MRSWIGRRLFFVGMGKPFVDPAPEERDLRLVEWFAIAGRRHLEAGLAGDCANDQAVRAFAGYGGRATFAPLENSGNRIDPERSFLPQRAVARDAALIK